MKRTSILISILLLAGCGSGTMTTSGGRAAVAVNLASQVFFGSGNTAPANLDVIVENRSGLPIKVRNIRVQSSGMVQWGIYPVQRAFSETIAPGEAKAFPMFATAVTRYTRSMPNEPLNVRAVVQFESGDKNYQELYTGRAFDQY